LGGATGLGIDRNIEDAYRFLSLNYVADDDDEIYLFGFSRGAYTVRSLAGMIYCSGLLDRPHVTRAHEAYELYRNRGVKPRDKDAVDYRGKYGDRVPITLLGCFDTVGSLGIPGLPAFKPFQQQLNKRYRFHDTTLNPLLQNALHAVAIDEIREVFDVTPMKKHPEAENQRVIQVWFPGEHGCVGGGTEEYSGLSDAALQWMMDSTRELGLGLEFDPSAIPTGINPNYECDFRNAPGFFKLAGIKFREVGDAIEELHESTIKRLQARNDYRPKNLERHLPKLVSIQQPEQTPSKSHNLAESTPRTDKYRKRKTIMATQRDTSRDGFKNKLETAVLTGFKPIWSFIQSNPVLAKKVNKTIINNAINKIPNRPYPFSTMSPYTSWDSLIDRSYSGLHLPPLDWKPLTDKNYIGIKLTPAEQFEKNLPPINELEVLYRKDGETKYSPKSSLIFPYFVQWFTDSFIRSDRLDPRRNSSNHHIDMCNVYGVNPKITHMLRSHKGGKLKSQFINGEEYPPFYYDEDGQPKEEFKDIPHLYTEGSVPKAEQFSPEKKQKLFAMGIELERANVQIGYVMMNVLCLREHNRVCDILARQYPTWDDERLFQTARNIVVVEFLRIVLEDYINHITPYHFQFFTDPLAFKNEKWYRHNWLSVEFSLVYRWHSMLPDTLIYNGQTVPMPASMWNNDMIISKGLGAIFEESCSQPAAQLGLFNTPDFLLHTELASIQMGRKSKLRSYNDYRDLCKYPRVTDFDQISGDERVQRELKRLYGHVDNIELYVGLYAEDLRPNSALPPLVGRLIGIDAFSQAFTNPLLAQNIFNPETFSPVGWEIIHNTKTLSDLVHRNIPEDKSYRISFYRSN
jgi:prostaglandin-endoperoxide synthase 2